MKKPIIKILSFFLYFVAILVVAYLLKWPQEFDSYVFYENYKFRSHFLLILYRVLIYLILPFVISLFEKIKSKERYIKLLLENFNIQFITYSIITGIYVIFGIDKVLGVDIFGSSDSILFIAGFIFTAILDKKIPSVIEPKK